MEKIIVSLRENLKKLKEEFDQENRAFQSQFGDDVILKMKINNNEKQIADEKEEMVRLEEKIAEVTERLANTTKNNLSSIDSIEYLNTNLTNLKNELEAKEKELARLKLENADLTKQLLAFKEKELKELKTCILEGDLYEELLDKLCKKQKEIDDLKNNNFSNKQTENKGTQTEKIEEVIAKQAQSPMAKSQLIQEVETSPLFLKRQQANTQEQEQTAQILQKPGFPPGSSK